MERKPFDPPRYATRGIMETLDTELQINLWQMIDLLRQRSGFTLDYLQVFELTPVQPKNRYVPFLNQMIHHRQEQPPYSASNLTSTSHPVSAKVFVIDSGEYATMLLADEY